MKRALTSLVVLGVLAGSALAGTFSRGLEQLVAGMPADKTVTVLLSLAEQADVAGLDAQLRGRQATRAERHQLVVGALMRTATASQGPLLAELQALKSQGKLNGFTAHWITNGVVVNAPVPVLRQLAARPDVEVAEADLQVESIEPIIPAKAEVSGPIGNRTPEYGILAINADDVWSILGITGVGALVGGIDTGVDGTHPALSPRWRGNNGHPVGECWLDAAGFGHANPTDTHGHGTHTMGTMCGGAPGDEVGVAPGAQWIASNCINMGVGDVFDNAVIASFEFMADPDGDPGSVDDVPDVVQNSWGINEGFGGSYVDCDSRWWACIDNAEVAGVCVTFSAGNEGPGGTSLRSPADRASSPYNCFSVGATDESNNLTGFSSRGPSGCGGAFAMKPEVSAPGNNTRSTYPGGGYTQMSGTSMAGPHVAGVVALMRSANPNVDVSTIKQILMDTAVDMGNPGEDNDSGHGFIDAYQAVLAVMSGYGTLSGTVTDASTALPIAGALVDNVGGPQQTNTNGLGHYSLMFPAGDYDVSYSAFGYTAQTLSVTIVEDEITARAVALSPAPSALLSGTVYGPDNNPVVGAVIDFTNAPVADVTTGAGGAYSVMIPTGYTYNMTATAVGVGSQSQTLTFNGATTLNFNLPVNPQFLPSGPDTYGYRIFDSNDAGGVAFEWNNIEGTNISNGDDVTQTVTVPFSFNFYGTTYTQLSIGSNGFVSPGATSAAAYTNGGIPDAMIPGAVYGIWDDLYPASPPNACYYEYQPAQGRFVIEWDYINYCCSPGPGPLAFQIHLLDPAVYPSVTGDAQWVIYYAAGERQSHTTGVDNPAATTGVQYNFNNAYDVHATPFSNGPVALLVSTNPNGFVSDDPNPVLLPPAFDLGTVFLGYPVSGSYQIYNMGLAELQITSITPSGPELVPSAGSYTIPPLGNVTAGFTFTPASPGAFSGTLTLANNSPSPTVHVTISANVQAPPALWVSPAAITETLQMDQTSVRTLTIGNSGDGPLTATLQLLNLVVPPSGPRPEPNPDAPSSADESRAPVPSVRHIEDGSQRTPDVLILRNNLGWGYDVNQPMLESLGATVSVAGGADIGVIDLSLFDMVVVESQQDQGFYQAMQDNVAWFEAYVQAGGVLEIHLSTYTNLRLPGLQLPGGAELPSWEAFDYDNYIVDPNHPITVGLTDPFVGNFASHEELLTLPVNAHTIIANTAGNATVVEYPLGGGHVLLSTMTWEWAVANGYSAGDPLAPALAYMLGIAAGPDWIALGSSSVAVPAGSSVTVDVLFDATGLVDGVYTADIAIDSNDPEQPHLVVPATLVVGGDCATDLISVQLIDAMPQLVLSIAGGMPGNTYTIYRSTLPYAFGGLPYASVPVLGGPQTWIDSQGPIGRKFYQVIETCPVAAGGVAP